MKEGVILFDPQGLVFLANPAAKNLLGLGGISTSMTALQVFKGFDTHPPDRLKNLDGQSAADYARSRGHAHIEKLLKRAD